MTQLVTLADLPPNIPSEIVAVREPGALGDRLCEMGLLPGTQVTVMRRGLWGDPLQVAVRGTMLTLRRTQARTIDVKTVDPTGERVRHHA